MRSTDDRPVLPKARNVEHPVEVSAPIDPVPKWQPAAGADSDLFYAIARNASTSIRAEDEHERL